MLVVENGLPGVFAVKIIPLIAQGWGAEVVPSTFSVKQPLYLGGSLLCCVYSCTVVKV